MRAGSSDSKRRRRMQTPCSRTRRSTRSSIATRHDSHARVRAAGARRGQARLRREAALPHARGARRRSRPPTPAQWREALASAHGGIQSPLRAARAEDEVAARAASRAEGVRHDGQCRRHPGRTTGRRTRPSAAVASSVRPATSSTCCASSPASPITSRTPRLAMDSPTGDTGESAAERFATARSARSTTSPTGPRAFPKERLEVFAQGACFSSTISACCAASAGPGSRRCGLWRQDKGQAACAAAFLRCRPRSAETPPIPFEEMRRSQPCDDRAGDAFVKLVAVRPHRSVIFGRNQVYGRVWFRAYRPRPDRRPAPAAAGTRRSWHPQSWRPPLMPSAAPVSCLNVTASCAGLPDWDDARACEAVALQPALFRRPQCAGSRRPARRGIAHSSPDGCTRILPARGTGWEPYPTSLRIVNWIKWALAAAPHDAGSTRCGCGDSLAVQARWLGKQTRDTSARQSSLGQRQGAGVRRRVLRRRGGTALARHRLRTLIDAGAAASKFCRMADTSSAVRCTTPSCSKMFWTWSTCRVTFPGSVPAAGPAAASSADSRRACCRWLRVMTHPDGEDLVLQRRRVRRLRRRYAALAAYARALDRSIRRSHAAGPIEPLADFGLRAASERSRGRHLRRGADRTGLSAGTRACRHLVVRAVGGRPSRPGEFRHVPPMMSGSERQRQRAPLRTIRSWWIGREFV